jgi:TonB family protein
MRKLLFFALSLCACHAAFSQTQSGDTTIYQVVEELPRFPVCEQLDTTLEAKQQCAQQLLMSFVNGNINYPLEARQNGNEGTVVVSFVVEKDGSLSNPRILRDIGGGCGLEVLRVINLMNFSNIRWVPGKIKGQPVRSTFNLPVRFRLQEAPPYTLINRDTVYTRFDEPLSFIGGEEALVEHLNQKLKYPESGNDSCLIGTVDVQVLVRPNGNVRVLNMVDYCNLGFDFWYAATETATSTLGKWKVATFENRKVPAAYDFTLYFEPTAPKCKPAVERFLRAATLAEEGSTLFNDDKKEEGLEKMTQAIALFPGNANFLYLRGQAYLEMNRLEEACADLTQAQDIALTDWYSGILPVICR